MKYELINNTKLVPALLPTVTPLSAGVANGLVIDRLGLLTGIVGLAVGEATGTPTAQSVKVKIQTGDESNGSDMADFLDSDGNVVESDELTANSEFLFKDLLLVGAKKYIRGVITVAFTGGTTPAIATNLFVALGDAQYSSDVNA